MASERAKTEGAEIHWGDVAGTKTRSKCSTDPAKVPNPIPTNGSTPTPWTHGYWALPSSWPVSSFLISVHAGGGMWAPHHNGLPFFPEWTFGFSLFWVKDSIPDGPMARRLSDGHADCNGPS